MPLSVGLIGFGRTGSVVAKEIALDTDLSLKWVCRKSISSDDPFASHSLGYTNDFAPFVAVASLDDDFLKANPVDIVIDFSSSGTSEIYERLSLRGIKLVSAISNYGPAELELLKAASKNTSVLYSPNITLGINWLIMASKMLRKIIPHADVEVVEEHFRAKKDVSGTALKLARQLDIDPTYHVNSIRVGGIVGKHEVIFGLPHQTIRLTHESVSRAAFGTGAIFAAKWLNLQKTGFYSMESALEETFNRQMHDLSLV